MEQIQPSNKLVFYQFSFQVIFVKQIGHRKRRYKRTHTPNRVDRIPKGKVMVVTFYNPVTTQRPLYQSDHHIFEC